MTSSQNRPILYSFRRCPYAMRARLAIAAAGIKVELREVVLRDKPPSMLEASPKATVPVLIRSDGTIIAESLEIMYWALEHNDPLGWLTPMSQDPYTTTALINQNDGPFKRALDRYKYPVRYPDENIDPEEQREIGFGILRKLEARLKDNDWDKGWLFGPEPTLVDMALFPFIRQFAHVDRDWFYKTDIPVMQERLQAFLDYTLFKSIMKKYDQWEEGTEGVAFPPAN